MIFREIAFGSDDYRRECSLRDEVLRVPLKLSLRDEDLSAESDQLHFGLFDPEGGILACVVVIPVSADDARIRQMAVSPLHQGTGLGRKLMTGLERNLRSRGFTRFTLHARASALGFYQKLDFTVTSGEFLEVGIPHFVMEKEG